MNFVIVYITTKDRSEAAAIGKALVEERLGACANIIDGMSSVYRWENRVVEDNEAILIVKTRESLFEKLLARVKELHSYTCPCVVAMPLLKGNGDYLSWLEEQTTPV